jgi:hypothetical protein
LQRVLNAVFRSVFRLKKTDHISALQRQYGFLSIEQRICLRSVTVMSTAMMKGYPEYVRDHLVPLTRERSLRSNDLALLECPRAATVWGERAMKTGWPKLWNSLPETVRQAKSVNAARLELIKSFFYDSVL